MRFNGKKIIIVFLLITTLSLLGVAVYFGYKLSKEPSTAPPSTQAGSWSIHECLNLSQCTPGGTSVTVTLGASCTGMHLYLYVCPNGLVNDICLYGVTPIDLGVQSLGQTYDLTSILNQRGISPCGAVQFDWDLPSNMGYGGCGAATMTNSTTICSGITPTTSGGCATCGDGTLNMCCAGGSWAGQCGDGMPHSWQDGYYACNNNPTTPPSNTCHRCTQYLGDGLYACDTQTVTGSCPSGWTTNANCWEEMEDDVCPYNAPPVGCGDACGPNYDTSGAGAACQSGLACVFVQGKTSAVCRTDISIYDQDFPGGAFGCVNSDIATMSPGGCGHTSSGGYDTGVISLENFNTHVSNGCLGVPVTTVPPTTVPPTTVPPTTVPPLTTIPPTTVPPLTTVPPTTIPPLTTVPPTTPPINCGDSCTTDTQCPNQHICNPNTNRCVLSYCYTHASECTADMCNLLTPKTAMHIDNTGKIIIGLLMITGGIMMVMFGSDKYFGYLVTSNSNNVIMRIVRNTLNKVYTREFENKVKNLDKKGKKKN